MSELVEVATEGELVDYRTPEEWGATVRSDLARSVEGLVAAGRHLGEAKSQVLRGEWLPWIERELPIGERAVQMLMSISQNHVIANPMHASDLPPSLHTLSVLARMKPAELEAAIADKRVTPELERKQARQLVAGREAQNPIHGSDFPQDDPRDVPSGLVSTIVADPPWRYGNTSTRGAAADHYPTMSIEEICDLDIAPTQAADEAHLYLWATAGHLPEAFKVMQAWGFTYKTYLVWTKPQMGMGNYFRVSTELVLFGIKGKLRTQDMGLMNYFQAPRGKHSAKPLQFYDIVERASPGPYLEMFARCYLKDQLVCHCSKCRLGWNVWGNQS